VVTQAPAELEPSVALPQEGCWALVAIWLEEPLPWAHRQVARSRAVAKGPQTEAVSQWAAPIPLEAWVLQLEAWVLQLEA